MHFYLRYRLFLCVLGSLSAPPFYKVVYSICELDNIEHIHNKKENGIYKLFKEMNQFC